MWTGSRSSSDTLSASVRWTSLDSFKWCPVNCDWMTLTLHEDNTHSAYRTRSKSTEDSVTLTWTNTQEKETQIQCGTLKQCQKQLQYLPGEWDGAAGLQGCLYLINSPCELSGWSQLARSSLLNKRFSSSLIIVRSAASNSLSFASEGHWTLATPFFQWLQMQMTWTLSMAGVREAVCPNSCIKHC